MDHSEAGFRGGRDDDTLWIADVDESTLSEDLFDFDGPPYEPAAEVTEEELWSYDVDDFWEPTRNEYREPSEDRTSSPSLVNVGPQAPSTSTVPTNTRKRSREEDEEGESVAGGPPPKVSS